MNASNHESAHAPNQLKVGAKVYFVSIPWRNDRKELPEVTERTVKSSSQKQIRLDGFGPHNSRVFWIDASGRPRHGDCGSEPAFYPTRTEAIEAFKRDVNSRREGALAVLASCDAHDAWVGGAA